MLDIAGRKFLRCARYNLIIAVDSIVAISPQPASDSGEWAILTIRDMLQQVYLKPFEYAELKSIMQEVAHGTT